MLIALDINSKRCGVAFGGVADGAPRVLTWALPGGLDIPTLSRGAASLYSSLSGLSKLVHPEHVFIEAPLQMTDRSAHTELVLIALFGAACAAGANAGANVNTGHVGTWRRHFIGRGNMPGKEAKAATIARCHLFGWKVENHDEADAAGLWSFGMSITYPKWAPKATPLFANGRAA